MFSPQKSTKQLDCLVLFNASPGTYQLNLGYSIAVLPSVSRGGGTLVCGGGGERGGGGGAWGGGASPWVFLMPNIRKNRICPRGIASITCF